MSSAASSLPPRSLPRFGRLEASALPLWLKPLSVLAVLDGELGAQARGERLHLRAGELLVLRSGEPVELERCEATVRLALFEAAPTWVDAFRALHDGEPEAGDRVGLALVPGGSGLSRRVFQLLEGISEPDSRASERLPPSTIAALLEVAFQAQGTTLVLQRSRRQAAGQRKALIRALADYDPEAEGDFSLDGLAERLGLSSRQTARLVRGETGHSFRELKSGARIERARKLLASSDLSMLEVALRAGWNSTSQFHEAFRRSVGVTPARYRAARRA